MKYSKQYYNWRSRQCLKTCCYVNKFNFTKWNLSNVTKVRKKYRFLGGRGLNSVGMCQKRSTRNHYWLYNPLGYLKGVHHYKYTTVIIIILLHKLHFATVYPLHRPLGLSHFILGTNSINQQQQKGHYVTHGMSHKDAMQQNSCSKRQDPNGFPHLSSVHFFSS